MRWSSLPLPFIAFILVAAGVIRIRESSTTTSSGDGFLLAGCGITLVGAWLAIEMRSRNNDIDHDRKVEPVTEKTAAERAAEATAAAIDKRTKRLTDASQELDENDPSPKDNNDTKE